MIKIKYIFPILAIALFIYSCKRDTNGPLPDKGMKDATFAYVKLDTTSDVLIDLNNVNAFKMDYEINTLFPTSFKKLTLVVVYNGDYDHQYVLKDDITSVPVSGSITTADLVKAITALSSSADIKAGDAFKFFANVTLDDGTYLPLYMNVGGSSVMLANPDILTELSVLKHVNTADVTINVPCAYNQDSLTGSYYEVSADWATEGNVTITPDATNKYTVYIAGLEANDGLNEDKGPLKLVINPKDYSVTVVKTVLASTTAPWGPKYTYSNIAYAGIGTVNTCTGEYDLTVEITVDEGSFGTFHFVITKN